jgi:hypothetical protein
MIFWWIPELPASWEQQEALEPEQEEVPVPRLGLPLARLPQLGPKNYVWAPRTLDKVVTVQNPLCTCRLEMWLCRTWTVYVRRIQDRNSSDPGHTRCAWGSALRFTPSFLGRTGVWTQEFCIHKAGSLPLDPHLQSILLYLLWRWSLTNYLPGLAPNHNPPDLSLLNSSGYRHEPLAPSTFIWSA